MVRIQYNYTARYNTTLNVIGGTAFTVLNEPVHARQANRRYVEKSSLNYRNVSKERRLKTKARSFKTTRTKAEDNMPGWSIIYVKFSTGPIFSC